MSEGMQQVMLASLVTEQSTWRRRLVEALTRLVLFSQTNTDADYFQYLLVQDAHAAAFEAKNSAEDFGIASATLARRAADLRDRLVALPVALPVWYATGSATELWPVPATKLHRSALSIGSAPERSALAYSYARGFSEPSSVMHFSTTARRADLDEEMLRFGVSHVLLLATAIARRVADLAGLAGVVALTPAASSSSSPLVEIGDFVVVILDRENVFLGEVTGWKKQIGPVGGICVRFLDGSPYPDVPDDELPSDLVHLHQRHADLMAGFIARAPEMADLPEEERRGLVRDGVRQVWRLAMRTVYLRALEHPGASVPSLP